MVAREWASSGSSYHPGCRAEQANVSGREASSTRLQAQGVCQARASRRSTLVSFPGPVCRHQSQLPVDEASWRRPAPVWPFPRPWVWWSQARPRKGPDPDSNPSSTANLAGNSAFSLGPRSTASPFRVGVGQFYCCPHQPAEENHTKTVAEDLSEQVFLVGGRGFPKGERHPPSSISPTPRRRPGPGRLCRPGSCLPVERTWADQLWPRLPVPPQNTGANTLSWGRRLAPDSLSSLQGPVFPLLTSLLGSAWPRLSSGSPPCAGSWGAGYGVGGYTGVLPLG